MTKNKTLIIVNLILVIFLVFIIVILNNNNKYLKSISFQELEEKIESKETFILYVKKDKCSACQSFTPTFKKVLTKNKVTAYSFNLTDLKEKDEDEFDNLVTGINATPTVVFYENGIDIGARFIGTREKEYITSKLKDLGYIK